MIAHPVVEWALMITLNGWIVEVDRFNQPDACWERQQIYARATSQAGSPVMSWCEKRSLPVKG